MPYAHTKDCALYYEQRGETGSPLLLIAGYGTSLASWSRPLLEAVAAQHRVILFDNRGVGNSGKPERLYTMGDFVEDVAAVLDAAGIESAHVMGVSMGGMIAQNVALCCPERVRSLVLGCTMPAGPNSEKVTPPSRDVQATLLAPRTGDPAQDTRNLWPILYSEHFRRERQDRLEELLQERLAYPPPPQYALNCQMYAVAETHDVLDRLCDIRVPTLVLTGTNDVLIPPQNSRMIAEHIPGAQLIEYEGAGHAFIDEVGEQVVQDVLGFLQSVDGERGEAR